MHTARQYRIPHNVKSIARTQTETPLRGWHDIAGFLGQPLSTAQRWAKNGMPVRREGRYVVADRAELSRWLGRESGTAQPVHVAAAGERDLSEDLRRGLTEVRRRRRLHRVK